MGDATAPAPAAQGTLEARPLSHLLVYLRLKRLTGRLMLRAPDGRGGAIAVWRGQVVATRTSPPIAYFGSVAAELGVLDRATAEATQREAVEKKRLHGELLIERGTLTTAQRDAVLVEQSCRKIHHMLTLPPPSAFAFYEDKPGPVEPPGAVDPIAPLWRGLRDAAPSDVLTQVLAPFVAGGGLRIVNEAPISRAAFAADERAICDALMMRPMTLSQLRSTFPSVPPARIDRLVYLLLITSSAERASMSRAAMPRVSVRTGSMSEEAIAAALKGSLRPARLPSGSSHVAVVAPPAHVAVVAPPAHVPSASPPRSPSASLRAAGIAKPVAAPNDLGAPAIALRAETVEDEDPFVTLGLRDEASIDEARAGYLRLVKMWHPDRLPAELAAVRTEVGKIFTQMTQAHQTLTDAAARNAFLTARAERAALLHRPRKDVLRLIDMALGKKDWPFATQEAEKLIGRDPDDAEAQSVLAWVASVAGEGPDNAVRAALPILDRAINRDTQCVRALFYRGMIHKRLNNAPNAYRDFARVVALDPKHVDATREVRIHEMRMKKR